MPSRQPEALRVLERALQAVGAHHVRQVDQSAPEAGYGDATTKRGRWGPARAVHEDRLRSALGRDLDLPVVEPQSPQLAGRPVAQKRAFATGEHGGHEAPVQADALVPDGVDAAVDPVQAPGSGSVLDRSAGDAEVEELPPGDDAVLFGRLIGHLDPGCVELGPHTGPKSTHPQVRPPYRGLRRLGPAAGHLEEDLEAPHVALVARALLGAVLGALHRVAGLLQA